MGCPFLSFWVFFLSNYIFSRWVVQESCHARLSEEDNLIGVNLREDTEVERMNMLGLAVKS